MYNVRTYMYSWLTYGRTRVHKTNSLIYTTHSDDAHVAEFVRARGYIEPGHIKAAVRLHETG